MAPDSTSTDELSQLLRRLADRERVRSEATVQADVRQLLLTGGLGLADHDLNVDLEAPVGDRRRIDIEVGFTVIEVKRDLRNAGLVKTAEEQLAGYVLTRATQTGQRYVGVLTDGREWRAYHERQGKLVEATQHLINPTRPDAEALLFWLEGVLATQRAVSPTPHEIKARLGATSASYALDRATLAALYAEHGNAETIRLKRQLWSRLLVVALDVTDMAPASLLGRLAASRRLRPGRRRLPQRRGITPVGAHTAITAVTKLSSVRAQKRLLPLADALETRRGSDYAELARQARQVATTRALPS